MNRRSSSLPWLNLAAASTLATSLLACGPPTAKAPNPTRPIDEGRAVKIIAQSIRSQGFNALPPRMITLAGGTEVQMDVSVNTRLLGFVYLTGGDIRNLANDPLAQRRTTGNDLIVRRGQDDDEQLHVVILYASDYLYDDNVGEHHESTAITAENKLERDARDFLMIARKNNWP